MLLFIMTCVTCGALLGMMTYAVLGPILITLALIVTLTCLWAGGALTGIELIGWVCLGAVTHQLAFLLTLVGRHWAGDPLALAQNVGGPADAEGERVLKAADPGVEAPSVTLVGSASSGTDLALEV